jgi:rubrerythrin
MGRRTVLADEKARFQCEKWELIEDKELRKQILQVRDQYLKHLELVATWFEGMDRDG